MEEPKDSKARASVFNCMHLIPVDLLSPRVIQFVFVRFTKFAPRPTARITSGRARRTWKAP